MSAKGNLTAVLYGIDDLRLENRPVPEPNEDGVLIRMGKVGICGSDVHYLKRGRISNFIVRAPMVMGHEASGTVVKVGKKVTTLQPGDRVAIEPGVPCRICSFCKGGKYNLCHDMKFCATPPVDGNLAHYFAHPADFCFKLPDHVTLEEGAMLEPLSVGVHACRQAGVTLGSEVLILGAGPIGLVTIFSAKAMGASKVIVTDLLQHRLDVAKECGADEVLLINAKEDVKVTSRQIQDLLGSQPDKTVDCGGFQSTIRLGLEVTKSGGTFVLVGLGCDEVTIPLADAATREIEIKGVFRYANDYPLALAMVASGKANLKPLVTHRFKLEETLEAFEVAAKGKGNPIKVMISCD